MPILGHESNPANQGGRIPGPERGLGKNLPGPIGLDHKEQFGQWEVVVDKYATLDDQAQREAATRVKKLLPEIAASTEK